ncbi:DUF445 family protein [Francisella frigiditurris]|uniref:DUF445 domain-containing protein n=1 Tax=Francisella frigiditurris TaxID=1542390 RepID=A0A1J0KRU0_9GAMM|nr:DUF445 family protein [Francisella frigiditurris]APC96366.1 hypothetical protein KX01_1596 [Francisella frigiditurris]
MFSINKSFLTNLIALLLAVIGVYMGNQQIKSVGFYALSGAITNWIAIYMLFEKIPFVYGSGIIPNKFENFKRAIKNMIMHQFFSEKNIEKFLSTSDMEPILKETLVKKLDYNKIFDSFIDAIMSSSYGSMIDMFLGGRTGLESLREKFIEKIDKMISDLLKNVHFDNLSISSMAKEKIESIVNSRLDELTPKMVKDIIQQIIREHLAWLVVWGGIFGGVIGFIASYF